MLTWAAKWLGHEEVEWDSLHRHGTFNDDRPIAESLWKLLDEADIVIGHNCDKFDIRKVNARFLIHGMPPPSPYRTIDTLKEARKVFALTSNRLDAIGDVLGVGRKLDTGGFDLWARCIQGDSDAFEEMAEYNVQDVQLLEDVYLSLRPWMKSHPNLGVYNDIPEPECGRCGSANLQRRGYRYTNTGKYIRYQCNDCGGWGSGRFTEHSPEKRATMIGNLT